MEKMQNGPWLVWLSGLSAGLRTKGSLVRFPVRAHAWVAGKVPSRGRVRSNHKLMFLSPSFPSPLSKNKLNFKKIEGDERKGCFLYKKKKKKENAKWDADPESVCGGGEESKEQEKSLDKQTKLTFVSPAFSTHKSA